jgi:hypothetical protein
MQEDGEEANVSLERVKDMFVSERYNFHTLLPEAKPRKVVQWRMQQRVCLLLGFCPHSDENRQCSPDNVPQHWSGSSRCCKDFSLCSPRVLDW